MSCLSTALVAFLAAIAGGVGGIFLGALCVDWYRISGREGLSGYFVVSIGLVGIVVGAGVGVICSRLVGAGPGPAFLRSLGLSLSALAVLFAAVTAVCRLRADIPPPDVPPTIEGKILDLDVEVRFPPGHPRPEPQEVQVGRLTSWNVAVNAHTGERRQSLGALRPADAFQADGRWVVPGETALTTSSESKSIGLYLGPETAQFFDLPLPSHPTSAHLEWSPWLATPFNMNRKPLPPGEAVDVRYRVRLHVEPSPSPSNTATPRTSSP